MWTLTKAGFTSAVAYDPAKDRDKTSPFPAIAKKAGTHILVRARVKEHLEPLKSVCPNLVIHEDSWADYKWRAVITRGQFKKYLMQQVDEIDYDSHFKEALRDAQPKHLSAKMYSAAMTTWTAFANLQGWSQPKHWKGGKGKGVVQSYQQSKGVKPFNVSTAKAMPLFEHDSDDLNLSSVVTLIKSTKGSTTFTAAEHARMTPMATSFLARLHSKFGTQGFVSDHLLDNEVDAFLADYAKRVTS